MGRSLWLPLVAVVLTALVQSTKLRAVESDDAVKKEILELQEKQNQAFLQASVNFLDRIYADTIAWTRPNWRLPHQITVSGQSAVGKRKVQRSHTHDDLQVHVYGDTVVVTGHSTTNLQYEGRIVSAPRRFANVWLKQDGQWRLVVHHVTPIAGE